MQLAGTTPSELAMLARLARDLPGFVRHPIGREQAETIIRQRLETREAVFLAVAERLIYRNPRSPYRWLLRMAGCEPGDLRALVGREGLEGALEILARRGVYLSFEEFKGREIVRGSARLAVREKDFDNPTIRPHFVLRTGGTRGQGTPVPYSLGGVFDMSPITLVALEAHGLGAADHVVWETAPFVQFLRYRKIGSRAFGWFHSVDPLPWKVRAFDLYLRATLGALGQRIPRPVWNDLAAPERLAEWLGERQAEGYTLSLLTYASSVVRVATAAAERGIGLERVCFIAHGEPFSEGKQRAIDAAGARVLVRYGMVDGGLFGYACTEKRRPDDLHFCTDGFGLIQQPRQVGDFAFEVGAFLLTTLLPHAPKVLLNVEIGDHGTVERRACGCPMGALGLDLHLSEIRSHEKLTGEGMTFVRTRLLEVLEEVLPARFGGSSADYQVLEEEAANGILRLALLVHPRLGPLDESVVKDAFLDELGRGTELEAFMARVWERAGTVEVRRRAPLPTKGGKIQPFHVTRQGAGVASV